MEKETDIMLYDCNPRIWEGEARKDQEVRASLMQ